MREESVGKGANRGMEGSKRQSGKWKNQDGGAVVQNLKRREFAKGLKVGKKTFHFTLQQDLIICKDKVSIRQR